ncbi:MAG TPA: lysozyme inhibitor LprI family protein [Allosphingosinicella sp.]
MSILLSTLLAASAMTSGPSFDCSRATSATERTICADPDLAKADRIMAVVHGKAIRRDGLRREQREWLALRDSCADNSFCLAATYEARIAELMDRVELPLRYARRGSAAEPASLDMASLGEGAHLFVLYASWVYPGGANANTGGASGMVTIAGDRGIWREGNGCTLTFVRNGRGWTVEEGEQCVNGLNVTMAGDYRP